MKVSEFRKWLDGFPDDAEVQVVMENREVDFQPSHDGTSFDDGFSYYDFSKPFPFVTDSSRDALEGRKILVLGETD